jgi:hypothetical protein
MPLLSAYKPTRQQHKAFLRLSHTWQRQKCLEPLWQVCERALGNTMYIQKGERQKSLYTTFETCIAFPQGLAYLRAYVLAHNCDGALVLPHTCELEFKRIPATDSHKTSAYLEL